MRSAVITIVAGRQRHLRAQRAALSACRPRPDLHVVVALGDPTIRELLDAEPDPTARAVPTVCVDVPADPRELPLAAGRNAGASAAVAAGAQLLVFLDVDCLPAPDLVERYAAAAARRPDAIGCGPVTYLPPAEDWTPATLVAHRAPHPARPDPPPGALIDADPALFWSLSFAVRADTWRRIGGFDDGYAGYGAEDTDFARTASTLGVPIVWVGGADAFHQHHPGSTPPAQHVDAILRNGARYARRWGEWPMTGWLHEFERLGLVRRAEGTWRRAAALRVASIPAVHPYVDAVRADVVEPFRPDRVSGWRPDPLWQTDELRAVRADLDLVHVHFGYDHLEPAQLDDWLAVLRELELPLVLTVHDLRNPHHARRARHDTHLSSLLAAADEVITLSAGAAAEIARRFGRAAHVVPHPTVLASEPPTPTDDSRAVLVPLKSLRRNVCDPAALVAAVAEGARSAGARVWVDVHPEAARDPLLEAVHRLAARGEIEVSVHERRSDAALVDRLAAASVLVLPYRFGTHSGWVELARDIGTRVVAPSCGYYADQWPEVIGYGNDEERGLDAHSLTAAVELAVREPRPTPAQRWARVAAREQARATHEITYRRASRVGSPRPAVATSVP